MSGFLLCWHRDGGRLDDAVLSRVVARLTPRGPEGARVFRTAEAVAVHTAFTDAVGAEDDLPIWREGWLLAADLRLDDRTRLREALSDARDVASEATIAERAQPTDASLCLASLRRWRHRAASHLLGDFAFAALDTTARELIVARGTFGVKPLFVAETPAFVAVANDIDALLALPGVDATPDERALVDFLRSGSIIDPWRTARVGVQRVPPSCQWVWRAKGARTASRHWEFPVPAPRHALRDDDLLAEFRELLGVAVADRLRTPRATIQLSGGLDSPAIAVAARSHARDVQIAALTVSHERLVRTDEADWARRVATHLQIPQEIAYADAAGLLAHCDDPTLRTPEPVADPELNEWRTRAAWLAEQGPVTIDGEDGDSLLAPPDLLTLLRTRPWAETWQSWRSYGRSASRRPWVGAREITGRAAAERARDWSAPSWLRAEVLARHGSAMPDDPAPHPLRPLSAWSFQQPVWETLFAIDDTSVTGAPLTVVLPLLDARLFAFVYAIAPIPWCQEKQLIRRAMAGRLPSEVLARPKTPVHGAIEAGVAAWRGAHGPRRTLAHPMDHLVDLVEWQRVLVESEDANEVMAAWRVYEVARWLAQPAPADG
jgi:asparagine synthase (glutamine-hydrolysing)